MPLEQHAERVRIPIDVTPQQLLVGWSALLGLNARR